MRFLSVVLSFSTLNNNSVYCCEVDKCRNKCLIGEKRYFSQNYTFSHD